MGTRTLRRLVLAFGLAALLGASSASSSVPGTYTVHKLSSNVAGAASHTDPDLVNGWGITLPPTGPWWVSDNGTDKTTLYAADGTKQSLVVNLVNGAPTGTVFNGGSGFVVSKDGKSAPARFIFASESGTISGWNPAVDPNNTVVGVQLAGAVYKGLALATAASGPQLYATDFVGGHVDVFNASWGTGVASGGFTDPRLPAGYAPFGIASVNGMLVVTFAKQQAGSADEQHHQGFGVVDAFDTDGNLLSRIATHGFSSGGSTPVVGDRTCAGKVRRLQRRPPDRQLRRRSDQRLRAAGRWHLGARRRASRRVGTADRHRRPVGHRLRQRRHGRADQHALLRRRP